MVDEVITKQELIDAKRDAHDLGKAVNEKVIVSPRYGEDFKSLPMISAEAQATIGEWESAIALITQEGGIPDLAVSTWSGRTQEEKNKEFVSLHDYCKCDGTDETVQFKAAVADALSTGKELRAFSGKITLSEDVSLRYLNFNLQSLEITLNGKTLHIGHMGGSSLTREQKLGLVKQNGSFGLLPANLTIPSVQVWGSKCTRFTFDQIDYMKLWVSTDPTTYPNDASIAYCHFYGNLLTRLDFETDPRFATEAQADGAGSANQRINSNFFHIARMMGISIDGSYSHNGNIFYSPTFENPTSYIRINRGNKNMFLGIRGESYPEVYFGEQTSGNIVERVWFSTQSGLLTFSNFTDLGMLNKYTSKQTECLQYVPLIDIDSRYGVISNGRFGNYNYRLVTRKYIRGTSASRTIYQTEMFDIGGKDVFFFECNSIDATVSRYAVRVYLYDSNDELITDFDGTMLSGSNFNASFSGSGFVSGSFNSTVRTWLNFTNGLDVRVKKVSLMLLNYSVFEQSRSSKINVFLTTSRNEYDLFKTKVQPYFAYNFVLNKPTAFIGRIGDIIPSSEGVNYHCTFALNTKVDVTMISGSTTLNAVEKSISGVGSISVGDLVGIDLDDGDTHWTSVVTISGGVTTLAEPLPSAASAGNNVYISRLV